MQYAASVPHATFRVTTEPVVLEGIGIPGRQQVLLRVCGTNRDPSVREHPDRLDVSRPPRQHLGFGRGIHLCHGATLAGLEGRVAFTALRQRFPEIGLGVLRHELFPTI